MRRPHQLMPSRISKMPSPLPRPVAEKSLHRGRAAIAIATAVVDAADVVVVR